MAQSRIDTRDPATRERLSIVAPRNVQWTSGDHWSGLIVEQYGHHSIETPEFHAPNHHLALHLSAPAKIDLKLNGVRRSRLHEPGDMSLFPAGISRQIESGDAHRVLVVSLAPELLLNAADPSSGVPLQLFEQAFIRDKQMQHIALALQADAESEFTTGPLYGESLGAALAARLLSQYSSKPISRSGGIAPVSLRRVIEYIHDNVDQAIRLGQLADIAGLSHWRFAHNFKRATGQAPHQYVLRVRLHRARQLLRNTNLSIMAIAQQVGWSSPSRFSALFHRTTGVTPSQYRASFR